ncbi:MAG TPA: membrane dipeptidase, partial [Aggregatilineales bacterium]|nr:membrane dipeptidase [Aggregatilineales bacterium]
AGGPETDRARDGGNPGSQVVMSTPDPFLIVDAHEDIALNALTYRRDFTRAARLTRQLEQGSPLLAESGIATTGLPDALLGRVGIIFGTLYVRPCSMPFGSDPCYETAATAYELALAQLDVYHRLADTTDRIQLIRIQSELESVLETWREGVPFRDHKLGIVVAMEGADPILEPRQFEEWYERGVRSVGLAWMAQTRYAGGNREPGPLTHLGRELLEVMASHRTILDLSHLAGEAATEALDRYEGPIIASHSNPRRFCDTDRHLSDTTIRRIAEHDGVIGSVPYNAFLQDGWSKADPKARTPFDRYIAVIDHICQVTGSARHAGIGSDLDGGFGAEATPADLDTVTDLYRVGTALEARGYSPDDVRAILGGNFLRILRATLPD